MMSESFAGCRAKMHWSCEKLTTLLSRRHEAHFRNEASPWFRVDCNRYLDREIGQINVLNWFAGRIWHGNCSIRPVV